MKTEKANIKRRNAVVEIKDFDSVEDDDLVKVESSDPFINSIKKVEKKPKLDSVSPEQ